MTQNGVCFGSNLTLVFLTCSMHEFYKGAKIYECNYSDTLRFPTAHLQNLILDVESSFLGRYPSLNIL